MDIWFEKKKISKHFLLLKKLFFQNVATHGSQIMSSMSKKIYEVFKNNSSGKHLSFIWSTADR